MLYNCTEGKAAEMRQGCIEWLSRSSCGVVEFINNPLSLTKSRQASKNTKSNENVGKVAEMEMHIKQMNQLPCADRKPYNHINKCAPDRPPLGGFMLYYELYAMCHV